MNAPAVPFPAFDLLDAAPDLVIVGRGGIDAPRLVWANAAFCAFAGVSLEALINQPPSILDVTPVAGLGPQSMGESLARNEPLNLQIEHPRDGSQHWFEFRFFHPPADGRGGEFVAGIGRDITAIRQRHNHLEFLATTDPMTRLANRRVFFEQLEREWLRLQATDSPFVTMLVDIDGLKAVNDAHGHAAGDEVVIRMAETLRQCVRERDVVARLGGEEFGVLMPETRIDQAQVLAETIHRSAARQPASIGNVVLPLSVSIGIGVASAEDPAAVCAMTRADQALEAAKGEGGITCTAAG